MTWPLKSGERLDDLQRGGLSIIQNPDLFCFGMDAVLLSAFVPGKRGARVLDLGCGNGIIPLLLYAREKGETFAGLEINEESADLARRSVALNGLEERITITTGDLREAGNIFPMASFDVVTSNPPYMTGGHGLTNADPARACARHEILCSFDDVARAASAALKAGGSFCLVHRPFRLAELIRTLSAYHLEPKRMRLVYPTLAKEPNMVLLEAVKGGRPRMRVEPPLIVYEEDGSYTEELKKLYYE